MKKIHVLLFLVVVTVAGFLSGCKKKDDAKPLSKAELLASTTSKKWKLIALTAATPLGSFDLFDKNNLSQVYLEDCQKDNVYIFYADKKYEEDEGATKCDSTDPQKADSGTWSISADETKLTISSSGGGAGGVTDGDMTIKELSSTTLKGEAAETISGVTVTLNATFTAQ
jgi:hypothetical protein